ncbi:S8 family serine peptidase [Cellulomonas humilata]|uniref:S8 family serine peptidase n=1 Tax=Cellulomonas humilata TaxID=144055 RepID=A0A7Y6DZ60_9CELL|nr:S8 family serine peptidase [Cellulomonas humilata]NUU18714.1 S8 family serine peptidase [Cellulomonas humilata]
MEPALHELLRSAEAEAGPDREIEALIRLRRPDARVPGVRLVARFGPIATCRIHRSDFRSVERHPAVLSLKAPRSYRPELLSDDELEGEDEPSTDWPPRLPRVRPPSTRRPRPRPLTGAGVVVGVVDWGLDFAHPEFRSADGRTRLLALWDQRDRSDRRGRSPAPYGYGRLHSRTDIDAALRTPTPYATLDYHPAYCGVNPRGAHGTHVAGIAVGRSMPGSAAGAQLVFVHLADRTPGRATMGDSVRLLEAIDFIRRAAGPRPWVVNLSMGRHGGPHDGSTLVERAFDQLLSSTPRCCIVQTAGNYYLSGAHASGRIREGEVRALRFRIPPSDPTINEVEAWYDGTDRLDVRLTPPGGRPGPWLPPGNRATVRAGGAVVGRMYQRTDPDNRDRQVDAFLRANAPSGTWTMELRGTRVVGPGRFHAWIERDDSCQSSFQARDRDRQVTTGTITNGRLPICVGAYDARPGSRALWAKSSAGPTRDGRGKPDCCAPGQDVRSARSAPRGSATSRGQYVTMSGTSMAAPAVTAAVAQLLEARPDLDIRQIRRLVLGTTRPGARDPDGRVGRGYLDLDRLLAAARRRSTGGGDAGDAPDQDPAYLKAARTVWKGLPGVDQRVTIRPLSDAPSRHVATSTFQAWTNSATEIFVSDLGTDPEVWKVVLFHEALHVHQFLEWGRPVSYEQMMIYEADAYRGTHTWGSGKGRIDAFYLAQFDKSASVFSSGLARIRAKKLTPAAREAEFKKFMLDGGFLPKGAKIDRIADLYEVWPAPRKPAGGGRRGRTGDTEEAAEFAGREHRAVADAGAGAIGPTSLVFEGSPKALGFGEVVALAGDYFASYDQMRELARSSNGRAQLAHARWSATASGSGSTRPPEPTGDDAAIRAVNDRAARLAATNVSHFSAEGANWREYSSWHAKALTDAVGAGADDRAWRKAVAKEAFGLHFLTDAFAAGHVRTPRGEIQAWYAKRYPGSQPMIDYLARFVFERLVARNRIPSIGLKFPGKAREKIADDIRQRAGAAADTYSLGDVVSLALHDFDGNGLYVVSDKDSRGRSVPGGHHWRAVGDGRLPTGRSSQDEAWRMAVAGVRASVGELRQVRAAGQRAGAARVPATGRADIIRRVLAADGRSTFAARAFVPREDPGRNPALQATGGTRAPLDWHWKSLGPVARAALDSTMRQRIPAELGSLVAATQDPDHRVVLGEFVQHLKDEGIAVLEKIYP